MPVKRLLYKLLTVCLLTGCIVVSGCGSPTPVTPTPDPSRGQVVGKIGFMSDLPLVLQLARYPDEPQAPSPNITYCITVDRRGSFQFANVQPGIYSLGAARAVPGQTAAQNCSQAETVITVLSVTAGSANNVGTLTAHH